MTARPPWSPRTDVPPGRGGRDDPPPPVRLADAGDLVAGLAHLVGFPPHESLVLIALGGPGGRRVGLTIRADLPDAADGPALARTLVGSLRTADPAGAVLAVVSEAGDREAVPLGRAAGPDLPHRALAGQVRRALSACDTPLVDAVLVRSGRWWSYDCPEPCCEPGVGTPVPPGTGALAAAAVAAGQVVAGSRDELVARIARPAGAIPAPAACGGATVDAGLGGRDGDAELAWRAVLAGLARCDPLAAAGTRLSDDDVAAVVRALRDVGVRDRALGLSLGPASVAAEVLWTECTRRAPTPLDATPATLLAVAAWLRGDGAMANIALDRALTSEPGHTLAGLLATALQHCLPPADLRAMISGLPADPPGPEGR